MNPIVLVVMALASLITAVVAVTSAISKSAEKQREKNDADIEAANAIQEEVDANNELYDSYLKTYEAYKQNKTTKQEMIEATKSLTDLLSSEDIAVANLTGDYDKLTEAILKKEQAENKKGLASAKDERNAAEDNLFASARKDAGRKTSDGRYKLDLNGGMKNSDEKDYYKMAKNAGLISKDQYDKGVAAVYEDPTIDIKYSADEIIKLYDKISKLQVDYKEKYGADAASNSEAYQEMSK